MSRPLARYTPSRRFLALALLALGGSLFSAWTGLHWPPAMIACSLFALPSIILFILALQPPIEVHELYLTVGKKQIPWIDVARLDQSNWRVPLAVRITLIDGSSVLMVYPGDFESAVSLLRQLRRYSKNALIDGVPYFQYWSQFQPAGRKSAAPLGRLLLPEDEAEVERLYQQLRKVGRLDSRSDEETLQ